MENEPSLDPDSLPSTSRGLPEDDSTENEMRAAIGKLKEAISSLEQQIRDIEEEIVNDEQEIMVIKPRSSKRKSSSKGQSPSKSKTSSKRPRIKYKWLQSKTLVHDSAKNEKLEDLRERLEAKRKNYRT